MDAYSTGRPTWVEISLPALRHNLHRAKQAAPHAAAWPVIKADAYGLGAVPCAHALADLADGFCVALVEEAEILRQAGISHPILILSGYFPGLERQIVELNLQVCIENRQQVDAIGHTAAALGKSVALHIEVNTGMARLGAEPSATPELIAHIDAAPGVELGGVLTHFACADEPERAANAKQVEQLERLLAHPALQTRADLTVSACNSAALLSLPQAQRQWIRPGIMLYGASPFHPQRTAAADGLQPVARWITHILQIHDLPAGTPLHYGHTYTTPHDARIAILPVGYADGYSRRLSNRGEMLIHGQRAPLRGRVCMDLIAVEVTKIPQAQTGDQVILMGDDGAGAAVTLEQMATWMETIPYETLTRLSPRLPRRYLNEDPV
ncbi:alanine racemase [Magnetofaba australis]|uniref:Alanine racemase n=1 Tax=Magnetofaba australis IT-1 TaxID=1434232 RepID=A0A1Y2K0E9_9PROT|nr:alanine racemase [Magnetofaba australis]OSM01449.1 putative alanine racemase [Magnetofaba australis IT-1]